MEKITNMLHLKMNKELIQDLLLEAQTNLRLYTSGQDDYAINRYNQLMELIRELKDAEKYTETKK